MTDGGIGRILVASLHQSIGDTLPLRLEYYEHWLTPMGLRDGRTGLRAARRGAELPAPGRAARSTIGS